MKENWIQEQPVVFSLVIQKNQNGIDFIVLTIVCAWIVETENVRFIENNIISGSLEPGKVKIQEIRVEIPSSITSSQVVVLIVVNSVNNL